MFTKESFKVFVVFLRKVPQTDKLTKAPLKKYQSDSFELLILLKKVVVRMNDFGIFHHQGHFFLNSIGPLCIALNGGGQ